MFYSSRLRMVRSSGALGRLTSRGVNSSCHDRFPELESVLGIHFRHTAEEEDGRSERSIRRRLPASTFRCQSVEVFFDDELVEHMRK
jgi:hypothetical protein